MGEVLGDRHSRGPAPRLARASAVAIVKASRDSSEPLKPTPTTPIESCLRSLKPCGATATAHGVADSSSSPVLPIRTRPSGPRWVEPITIRRRALLLGGLVETASGRARVDRSRLRQHVSRAAHVAPPRAPCVSAHGQARCTHGSAHRRAAARCTTKAGTSRACARHARAARRARAHRVPAPYRRSRERFVRTARPYGPSLPDESSAACAAATRATGTRNGEQLT